MPGPDPQHPVVQPDPFLLPPATELCLRRGHGDGSAPVADAAAPEHAVPPLARNAGHDLFIVAAVDAEERGSRLPGCRRNDRPFTALPRPQPGGARHRHRLLGSALSAAGVAWILCGDAAACPATPADGRAGRSRRPTGAPVPPLADRLGVGNGFPALVLDQE